MMSYELTMQLDLVETTALSKSSIRVLTADNGEFSVGLSEDDSLDSSVTEVKGNGNVGVIFIVDILDGVGRPGSVDWVAVIGGTGFHDRDGGAGNVGRRVNNGNLQARILFKHVIARIDSVVLRIVVPVDIRAEDSTTSQLLHQFSSAPLGFEVDTSEGFEAVDSLAVFGGATLVLEFKSGNGGGSEGQSRDELGEDHLVGSC